MKPELLSKVGRYEFLAEPFHCDFSSHLFMGHLGNHLLNAADFHSNDRGYGMNYLMPRHKTWVHKNDSSVEPNKNNDVTYKINDKLIEKIHFLLVENRNGTDIQTSKTLSNENVKISARSDLENFFPCPRKWIFKTVLKLKEDSLDTDLMQPIQVRFFL